MRYALLAAVAALATTATAQARDNSGYVAVEGGLLRAGDFTADNLVFREAGLTVTATGNDVTRFELDSGLDVDLAAGYDLGLFRVEGELGYKQVGGGGVALDEQTRQSIESSRGALSADDLDLDGKVSVVSVMANGLVDIGNDRFGAFAGAGVGRASVDVFGDSDGLWAYQLIAGARAGVTDRLDLGVKYRYFRTAGVGFASADMDTGGPFSFGGSDGFRSHSLLLSLTFNFAEPGAR